MKNGEFAYNKSYSTGYPYGAIKQLTKYDEGIVSPLYICFAPKAGTNTAFYTQYFEGGQYNREIYRVAQEGARNHGLLNIAVDDFFTGTLVEPSAGEQQKIAEILATCDRMIELKQSKIDELNKLKQVCLLEMFPQEGQTIPQRRFPGFSAPWEQHKLGGMASLITKGTTPLDKSNTGVVNFVKIESIDESSGNITITQKISLDEHNGYLYRSQLKENDILFSIAGTLGRVTSVKSSILPANTNQALAIIRLKDGCVDYVKTYLKGKAVADFIKKNPTIGAQPNLSLEQVANLEIAIPSEDEQKKIGDYFKQLDRLITLHQRELAEVGKYKKALMQLLLTGLVRVNA